MGVRVAVRKKRRAHYQGGEPALAPYLMLTCLVPASCSSPANRVAERLKQGRGGAVQWPGPYRLSDGWQYHPGKSDAVLRPIRLHGRQVLPELRITRQVLEH